MHSLEVCLYYVEEVPGTTEWDMARMDVCSTSRNHRVRDLSSGSTAKDDAFTFSVADIP